MNDFTDIVSKVMEVRPDDGDYTGEDGLLYCGKCHTPKEAYFEDVTPPCSDVTGIPRTAPVSKNAMRKSGGQTSSASTRTP